MSRSTSTSSTHVEFRENKIENMLIRRESRDSFGERKKYDLKCFPFKIPPHIKTFKGRLINLQEIKSSILENNIVVVSGRGGIGKSQLAKKFAMENKQQYGKNMLWINAESVDEITKAFKTLFSLFYYEDKNINLDLLTIVNYVYEYFESDTLIVFDNAISEDICQFLPEGYESIFVIVTSQYNIWKNKYVIRLVGVTEDEALDIFKEIMKDKYFKDYEIKWRNLAKQLGYLPMAIQIAGAFIHEESDELKSDYCVDDYIKDIKKHPDKLYDYKTDECKISLADTFELALRKIQLYQNNSKQKQNKNMDCIGILNICAHLDPYFITKELLIKFFGDVSNENSLIEYLRIIIRYSLLSLDSTNIYIHDEIQRNLLYFQEKRNEHKQYFFELLKLIIKNEEMFYYHRRHAMQYAERHAQISADFYKQTNSALYLKILTQYGCHKTLTIIFKSMCSCSFSCASPYYKIKKYSLLCDAVLSRNFETVKLILKYSNKVNIKNNLGWAPLRVAVELKCTDIQELLIQKGALNEQSKNGITQLHECLRDGHTTLVQFFMDIPTAQNLCDDYGNNSLHYAAMNTNINSDYYKVLISLVDRIENIDAVNKLLCSPLHICAEYDNLLLAHLLINRKANIFLQNRKGNTPLIEATIRNNKRMIKFLCEMDSSYDSIAMKNKKGYTVLHYAIKRGLDDFAVYFAGKRINFTMISDKSGNTAIHLAVILRRNTILPALLQTTMHSINIRNNDGDTPLKLAEMSNYDAIIYLEEYISKYNCL